MHASILLSALALSPLALAVPPRLPYQHFRAIYGRQNDSAPEDSTAPLCDLSRVTQPPNTLTPPSASMRLVLIALGEGTQNYTCASPTSAPSPIGAVAQLYDASCALAFNPTTATTDLASVQNAPAIGTHFFVDNTTPDFDIAALGNTQTKKVEDMGAPDATKDVKWLRLQAQSAGTTSEVKMIYRLSTSGGLAPATCEGKGVGEVVTVAYKAQYWVYA